MKSTICLTLLSLLFLGCGSDDKQNIKVDELNARISKIETQFSLVMEENQRVKTELSLIKNQINTLRKNSNRMTTQVNAPVKATPKPTPKIDEKKREHMRQRRRIYSLIRGMVTRHPPEKIAEELNKRRMKTQKGNDWNKESVEIAIKRFGLDRYIKAAQAKK